MGQRYDRRFRERAVRCYEDNDKLSYQAVAKLFGIGEATLKRWVWAAREGRFEALPTGGATRPRAIDDEGVAFLRSVLDELPDSTLRELRAALREEFGIEVHLSTVHEYVRKRLGYTLKRGTSSRRNAIERT